MEVIAQVEDALVAQWSHFGRWPGAHLRDEDGALWFETPIQHLPYNGVIRTRLEPDAADARIAKLMERFQSREVDCFWVVHPSATPPDLDCRIAAHGLSPVERMTCMSLELSGWHSSPLLPEVRFQEVVDDAGLEVYSDLTARYWEIPDDERELVLAFHHHWGPGRAPGHRYLAFLDGRPVGKAYLSLAGPPGIASIYGMFVVPEARGRRIAAGLTTTLLERARERGAHRAVLHSTDMAVGVYHQTGFVERCEITVFATAALWSDQH